MDTFDIYKLLKGMNKIPLLESSKHIESRGFRRSEWSGLHLISNAFVVKRLDPLP